jgi:hypothetical protein
VLACPFWKREPQAHGKCFPRGFNRISDVKSHLRRKHKQAASDYCQRCWVAFENKAYKASHLSDESGQRCKYDPAARPLGIDNAIDAALNKKSNPKYSTAEQWFVIWEIVFPDKPRPLSLYIDEGLSEDATQLIERIVNQWPSVLANDLGEAGVSAASNDLDRLKRENLIQATLVRLLDDRTRTGELAAVADTLRSLPKLRYCNILLLTRNKAVALTLRKPQKVIS